MNETLYAEKDAYLLKLEGDMDQIIVEGEKLEGEVRRRKIVRTCSRQCFDYGESFSESGETSPKDRSKRWTV